MCYTLPTSNGVLAIVYTDQYGSGRLIGRTAHTLSPDPLIPEKELDDTPSLVIPVKIEAPSQDPTFGVLLIGEKRATFVNTGLDHDLNEQHSGKGKGKGRNRSKSEIKATIQAGIVNVDTPFLDVTAWVQVDGMHLVVGDSFGRLYLLTMSMGPEFTLKCTLLGEVSMSLSVCATLKPFIRPRCLRLSRICQTTYYMWDHTRPHRNSFVFSRTSVSQ